MTTALPLSIRDVSPGDGAVRLTGVSPSGLPSGIHTGGAWLLGGEIWKPLDAKPYANCEHHYPTREAEILESLAGQPLFPRNWRLDERNGRRFVVRRQGWLIPEVIPYDDLTIEQALYIERGVRNMNRAGWEMGDPVALAVDQDAGDLYLYDLSNASWMLGGGPASQADEEWQVLQFFDACGFRHLRRLRENARHAIHEALYGPDRHSPGYCHAYASFNRPVEPVRAHIPGEPLYLQSQYPPQLPSRDDGIPFTWVITREALPEDALKAYEIEWGWSPLHV